jgi:hypothetical protein
MEVCAKGLQPVARSADVATSQDLAATVENPLAQTLARLSLNDADLTALLALWDRLPESGRKLLRRTAETLAGTLTAKRRR